MGEIILAIPSKGRLEEQAREIFAQSGMEISRPGGARSYNGSIKGFDDYLVRFLPASEIARELVKGNIDIGITGVDLIYEAGENALDKVVLACELGFGQADVVLAVPDAWIDVVNMYDLFDVAADFREKHGRFLRIATKYVNLTRQFLAKHAIAQYKIVQSLGATEAAPSSQVADIIVDISSTGSTLRANGLRILEDGILLKSEANLIISKQAQWSAAQRMSIAQLLDNIGIMQNDDE